MRAPSLVWATIALVGGILVAPLFPAIPTWLYFTLLTSLTGIGLAATRRPIVFASCFLIFLFLWGIYKAQQRGSPSATDVAQRANQPHLSFTGTVAAEPETTPTGSRRYALNVWQTSDNTHINGLLLITQTETVSVHPHVGDTVAVRGTVELPKGATNPEGFDYRAYLRHKSIFALLRVRSDQDASILATSPSIHPYTIAARLRQALLAAIAASPLTPDDKALLGGILLSERESIPADIESAFERTGAVHILSVSGLHLAVFAGIVIYLAHWLPPSRKLRIIANLLAVACVWFFALAAGLSSATIRSAVMITVLLLAPVVRRDAQPLHALVVAIFVILLLDPLAAYDVGALFSFACVGGLIVWLSALQHVLIPFESELPKWQTVCNKALLLLLAGVVAQVAALPLTAYHFSLVSLVAPLAGLVLIPLAELLLVIGLSTASAFAVLPLPSIFWLPSMGLTKALAWTAQIGATPPIAAMSVPAPPLVAIWSFYVAFFIVGLLFRWLVLRRTFLLESKPRPTLPQLVALPALGLIVLPILLVTVPTVSRTVARQQTNRIRVTFLDVGQGDAAVVETPDGKIVVVDGGGYPGQDERFGNDPGSRVVVPFLRRCGVNTIDLLIPTHPDEDHVQGLIAVARAFPIQQALDSGVPDPGAGASGRLRERLSKLHVPVHTARRGEMIALGTSGAVLEVLHPTDPLLTDTRSATNANSIVLRLRYRKASILLTGDAEEAAEKSLLGSGAPLQADVLKVGHHGSRFSSSAAFLAAVRPKIAVISVGAENNFGHPAPDVLQKLEQVGATTYRTDLVGAVTIETDGDRFYVSPTASSTN